MSVPTDTPTTKRSLLGFSSREVRNVWLIGMLTGFVLASILSHWTVSLPLLLRQFAFYMDGRMI